MPIDLLVSSVQCPVQAGQHEHSAREVKPGSGSGSGTDAGSASSCVPSKRAYTRTQEERTYRKQTGKGGPERSSTAQGMAMACSD